jgi:hypothetical protein
MIAWVNANLPMLLACWAALGALSGLLAAKLPAGFAQKLFAVLSHISPANLLAAWTALNGGSAPPAPPAPPVVGKPSERGFASMRSMLAVVILAVAAIVGVRALTGCQIIPAVPAIVDCGGRIADDAAAGMSLSAIVADVAQPCGMDVAQVIAYLLASKDPRVMSSPALAEAKRVERLFK